MTTASDRRRRRLDPADRREQILTEAVRYFAEVGLAGDTRALAKRLGVTQSLIFRYFGTKADLLEAVFRRVYLDRLSPDWPTLITDRGRPLRERLHAFYAEYTRAIFTYEWMRIFMFSGLADAPLNRRYFDHLRAFALEPMRRELAAEAQGEPPTMEDIWSLHGGVVYFGIRRFIYQADTPADPWPQIARTIDRFLGSFEVESGHGQPRGEQRPGRLL